MLKIAFYPMCCVFRVPGIMCISENTHVSMFTQQQDVQSPTKVLQKMRTCLITVDNLLEKAFGSLSNMKLIFRTHT